ncbi:MAG: hypothetical protein ACP5RD_06265 [bacterium]|jgi:hypothetical protein
MLFDSKFFIISFIARTLFPELCANIFLFHIELKIKAKKTDANIVRLKITILGTITAPLKIFLNNLKNIKITVTKKINIL